MEALEKSLVVSMEEFPDIYKLMLVDRNSAWIPLIEPLFKDEKVEFVLVGSAHLAGDDSVLKMLEERGYHISKL